MAENVIVDKQKLDNIVNSVNQKAGSSNQMTLDQIPPAINALNNIKNHSELEGRDSPNQHTMGAITGLNDALEKKLETTALSSAIDTALAQAKASGEFDGKDGATGPQGPAGLQGLRGETGSRGPEGKEGPKGDPGMGFQIFKIYKSVDLMNKDYATSSTVPVGGFVLVDTGNTGDADRGKLYVKTDSKFNFIIDMSGANGIQGPRGEKGLTGDTGPAGATGSVGPQGPRGLQGNPGEKGAAGERGPRGYDFSYSWSGTSLGVKSSNENSYKYVNLKGDKGEPGQAGSTGPAGKTPVKGQDYFTASEKEEFIRNILAEIPSSQGNAITFTDQGSPLANSQKLQQLIDSSSTGANGCRAIYIPAGTYKFGSTGQARGIDFCVRLKSNVEIFGDGDASELRPTGSTEKGLDMFYFNDYREYSRPTYLKDCYFHDFCIDATDTSCTTYSTAGKGFMANLIERCYWSRITIKNTDGTGLGVDCPINCVAEHVTAIGCGKACPSDNLNGASGIGIGFGYSGDETMIVRNCHTDNNKNWGIFYEHQRRFGETGKQLYPATANKGLFIDQCTASNNNANFGAVQGINVSISGCISQQAKTHGFKLENSELCQITDCKSNHEVTGSYVVISLDRDGGGIDTKDITISGCLSKYSGDGIKIVHLKNTVAKMERINLSGNFLTATKNASIYTSGTINDLSIIGNSITNSKNSFYSDGARHVIKGNSWQTSAFSASVNEQNYLVLNLT